MVRSCQTGGREKSYMSATNVAIPLLDGAKLAHASARKGREYVHTSVMKYRHAYLPASKVNISSLLSKHLP